MDGINISNFRISLGKQLAREQSCKSDLVTAVPDSGVPAAMGFAEESGIPYREVIKKREHYGRTFILPDQATREDAVIEKFHFLREDICGKKITVVDDSLVRGTTCRCIVKALRDAGAKEIHIRISSPPIKHCCYFGINTPTEEELVASELHCERIRKLVDADSLGYLSFIGLTGLFPTEETGLCTACLNGNYPIDLDR